MKPIISVEALHQIIHQPNIRIVDASYGTNALQEFNHEHIANAVFVDLNNDLSCVPENAAHGGRHPLPDPNKFAQTLQKLGITPDAHVIVYDRSGGQLAAARFWWMLRAIGHKNVQVLDGGFAAAKAAGINTNDMKFIPPKVPEYPISAYNLPQVSMQEVKLASENNEFLIIDVRAKERHSGEFEPIDNVAGHIPNAVNVPLTENLNEDGTFLTPTELNAKYSDIFKNYSPEKIIVHCGSGVTACHTLLATAIAGLPMPNLYVGSWSEYARNANKLITNQ